jgi:hypothetical protein
LSAAALDRLTAAGHLLAAATVGRGRATGAPASAACSDALAGPAAAPASTALGAGFLYAREDQHKGQEQQVGKS